MEEDEIETTEDRLGDDTAEFEEEDELEDEPLEDEEAPEAEQHEPTDTEVPVTPPSYTPPTAGETAEMAALREALDPDIGSQVAAAVQAEVSRAVSSALAAFSVSQAHVTTFAAEKPGLWRAYGQQAQALMAQSPAQTANREGVESALLMAALGPHIGKPTYGEALKKYTALYSGEAAPAVKKPPKAPLPPEQRPPSASVRSAPSSPQKESIEGLMRRYDLTRSEAEEMIGTVSRPLVTSRKGL